MIKKIQIAANVAIILVATLASIVLIKFYLMPGPGSTTQASITNVAAKDRPARDNKIQPGVKMDLPGIDWAKSGRTLLLALSDKCHFCSESAPFYQRLSQQHGKTRLVAVLPQSVEQGQTYLKGLNVQVDDIQQAPLTSFGIKGTPTLILVDSKGVAVKSWVGKLASTGEEEVLASLK